MSDYTHRMTLAVPEALMPQANQLALIVGESSDDDKTFAAANWQDKDGNLYAVCSTAIKSVVLGLFGVSLTDITLPTHAVNADVTAAQQALDKVVMYKQGDKVSTAKIMCAIDFEPLAAFDDMGLTIIESDLV
ncbi:hypothetical protein BTW00_05325 [Psychrobacter sp. C 20.9]|uniref:hypothetical protein n=1 Tax=Psychrobacter sp. C 20.9 TaxID=1926477 RepID=UPI000946AEB4|nr:hypothetical protein [Psychrobacter sp. C 20.9]OLF36509.1 hypothetical protein BTW00_05325 [Psychrobacter sp. C 20.9]